MTGNRNKNIKSNDNSHDINNNNQLIITAPKKITGDIPKSMLGVPTQWWLPSTDRFSILSVNSTKDENKIMGSLSKICKGFYLLFKPELDERVSIKLAELALAFMDDDRDIAKRMLESNPGLLSIDPPKDLIIESKLTGRKICLDKNPAYIPAKFKQIKMLELILPYYDKLPQTELAKNTKAAVLSAWPYYELEQDKQGEYILPDEYVNYANHLVKIFSEETFPNGTNGKLSDKTESELSSLFNILLPKQAVKLDNYLDFDVELLLLAVYQAYGKQFNSFQNWDQRDAFCDRGIGLIQSALTPEKAKIFCQSLDKVVTDLKNGKETKMGKKALSLKLYTGEFFYRSSRDSFDGVGSNFFCGIYALAGARVDSLRSSVLEHRDAWGSYVKQQLQIYKLYAATPKSEIKRVHDCLKNEVGIERQHNKLSARASKHQ